MIPDSTNVRVMADNIRKLKTEVENAVELPTVETTDEGKVLTVNSSGKWAALDLPPYPIGNFDYSTTETNIGVKWVDGKDIYRITWIGTTPDADTAYIDLPLTYDRIIKFEGIVDTNIYRDFNKFMGITSTTEKTSVRIGKSTVETYQSRPFWISIYYTKPTTPGNREPDEEPETKKSTKRKTTKGEN